MLFAVCADRGSPGVTTAALALASARGLPALVVEADPYGGDLALRLRPDRRAPLPKTPTLLGLAAAGRSTPDRLTGERSSGSRSEGVWRAGSHALSDLVRVVPGFSVAEQGGPVMWPRLADTLATQSVPVFADVGRTHRGSPAMPILAAADAVVPVCRGDVGSVQHMVQRLEFLVPAVAEHSRRTPTVVPVVIAPRQRGEEMAKAVTELLAVSKVGPTVSFVAWLAWDPVGCTRLETGENPWAKPLRKSPLMDSARKAVRLLGLATGLDHAEPPAPKRQRRPRRKEDAGTSEVVTALVVTRGDSAGGEHGHAWTGTWNLGEGASSGYPRY